MRIAHACMHISLQKFCTHCWKAITKNKNKHACLCALYSHACTYHSHFFWVHPWYLHDNCTEFHNNLTSFSWNIMVWILPPSNINISMRCVCMLAHSCTLMNIIYQLRRPILTYAESFMKIWLNLAEKLMLPQICQSHGSCHISVCLSPSATNLYFFLF